MRLSHLNTRSFKALAVCGLAASFALAGCGGGNSTEAATSGSADAAASGEAGGASGDVINLTVGASPSPHAKVLHFIQDNLAAEAGINLEIVEYTDYHQPNVALNSGDLDANFYQTPNFLDDQVKEFGYEFDQGEGVHIEPLGIFSEKIKDLKDFPDGGKIGIISDVTNQRRALELLEANGFVKIAEGDEAANINSVEKLKNFEFFEAEGAQLVRSLSDVDIAVINGNFAQEGGLTINGDALVAEQGKGSPYTNLLVWKKDLSGDKLEGVKKLDELLHSDEVRTFFEENWSDGTVLPAF